MPVTTLRRYSRILLGLWLMVLISHGYHDMNSSTPSWLSVVSIEAPSDTVSQIDTDVECQLCQHVLARIPESHVLNDFYRVGFYKTVSRFLRGEIFTSLYRLRI